MALLDGDIDGIKELDDINTLDFILYDMEEWDDEQQHIGAFLTKFNSYLSFIQNKIYLNNGYKDIYNKYIIKIIYSQKSDEYDVFVKAISKDLGKRNITLEFIDSALLDIQ